MHASSIFTRRRMGLDNNVWIILLACTVLSAGILGYKLINNDAPRPCGPVNITVNGRKNIDTVLFYTDQAIPFKSFVAPGDQVTWDFGDDTKKEETPFTVHVFKNEGTFTVRLTVNDICWYSKKVNIEKVPEIITDTVGRIVENIISKDQAMVGEKITFSTTLPASSYEWFVENNRHYPIKTGKEISYDFKSQTTYVVVLQLDHDSQKRFTKSITVSRPPEAEGGIPTTPIGPLLPPLPPKREQEEPGPIKDTVKIEPAKKTYLKVEDNILMTHVQAMVCKQKNPDDFDIYLCDGQNTKVIINISETTTFGAFCKTVSGKRIKIESVTANRDNGHCISTLTIKYDKKGFLGRNPCRN